MNKIYAVALLVGGIVLLRTMVVLVPGTQVFESALAGILLGLGFSELVVFPIFDRILL